MKFFATFFVGFALIPAMASARTGVVRPVRNAFVDRPVANTQELVAHFRTDRAVADRYERHFGMDRSGAQSYLGGLHRGALARTGYYTIYSVPPDGSVKMHVGLLRKGEPMFLNGVGSPVLVVRCGNPVVMGPARVSRANPLASLPSEAESARTLSTESDDPVASDSVVAFTPDTPESSEAGPAYVPPSEPVAPNVVAQDVPIHSGFSLNLIPALGGAAITSAMLGGHGGGRSTPVPEPSTVFALGASLALVARRRKM